MATKSISSGSIPTVRVFEIALPISGPLGTKTRFTEGLIHAAARIKRNKALSDVHNQKVLIQGRAVGGQKCRCEQFFYFVWAGLGETVCRRPNL
jgi:hypothetical protein